MKRILLFGLLFILSATSFAQDVFLGATKDKLSNYYIMSMRRNKNGSIEVLERVKPTDGQLIAFRQSVIVQRQKMKRDVDGFDKLGYYRRRIQINCKGKTYRMLEETYYDITGKEISTSDPDPEETAKWEFIPAGTMREIEFNKACQ